MDYDLVVTSAFGAYGIGARITDPTAVATILASPQRAYVVRAAAVAATPDPPAPSPYQNGDTIILLRDGADRILTGAQLATFFAPVLGPDTAPPTITTPAAQSVAENAAFSLQLTASEAATWTKAGGADAGLFGLTSAGLLTLPAQDYEAPADANGDRAYVVTVRATDATGNHADATITVTVTDVAEGGGAPADLTTNFDDEANSALVPGLTA